MKSVRTPGLEGLHVGTGRRHGGLGLGTLALDGFQFAAAGGQLLGGGARGVAGRLGTAAQVGQGLGKLQGRSLGLAQGLLGQAVGLLSLGLGRRRAGKLRPQLRKLLLLSVQSRRKAL